MSSDSNGRSVGRIRWCAPDVCHLDAIGRISASTERFAIRSSTNPSCLGGGRWEGEGLPVDTVDTVDAVDTVDTADTADTVDTVDTVDTASLPPTPQHEGFC